MLQSREKFETFVRRKHSLTTIPPSVANESRLDKAIDRNRKFLFNYQNSAARLPPNSSAISIILSAKV